MSFQVIVSLLSGLGAFLIGFKILSDSIEKLATKGLKRMFAKTSKSKLAGVGIGLGATAIVQSSSATTVMVVGFVNAGIMSLAQATTIIMGANIGTTITAQIVALKSFDIVQYAIILTAIGIFMNLLFKKDKVKTIGYALAGLGLVFLGLNIMSDSMSGFKDDENIINAFKIITNPFLLLLVGIGFTALVQSSSAVTSIIITLASTGIVIGNGGNSVLYLILGTNIGTCITAIISSIGANKNAKRASLIHLMFNVFGSCIFMIFLLCFQGFMDDVLAKLFANQTTQIAMFHTLFNVVCTLIFLPFTKYFVKLSMILIKDKKDETTSLQYMDERLLSTAPIAIEQLKKEVARLENISFNALNLSFSSFLAGDESHVAEINTYISNVQDLNQQIIGYLVKVNADTSEEDQTEISNMHHALADLLRISEIADNFIKYTKIKVEKDLVFSDAVIKTIKELYSRVQSLSELSINSFLTNSVEKLPEIEDLENEIDSLRGKMISDHIDRLNKGECKAENCHVFICLVNNLERVADHLNLLAHGYQ